MAATKRRLTIGRLINWILLRPHGDNLSTEGTSYWILSARLIIWIMASADALSWSYLGYHIGNHSHGSRLVATSVGIAMFLIIWILDSTFLTVDTAKPYYDRILGGKDEDSAWVEKWKLGAGLLLRVLVLSGTLYISAPYLALSVFSGDIESRIEAKNSELIANKRAGITSRYQRKSDDLQRALSEAQQEAITESQGKIRTDSKGREHGTGIKGNGPAVATIEKTIGQIKQEITDEQGQEEKELRVLDTADKQTLASKLGIPLLDDGIQTQQKILSEIIQQGTYYGQADLAIRGFLVFLFVSMCALKLFAPRSIQIYFSENLQGRYREYLQGNFNHWLEESEYPTAAMGGMNPLRFEEWIINTYSVLIEEDKKRRERDQIENDYRRKAEPLGELVAEIADKIGPRKTELKQVIEERISLESEAAVLDSDITRVQEGVVVLRGEHDDLTAKLGNPGRGYNGALTIQTLEAVQAAIEKERDSVRSLEVRRSTLTQRLDALETTQDEIGEDIKRMESTLGNVRTQIQNVMDEYTRRLGLL